MRAENIVWKFDLDWIAEKMGILPAMTVCECAVGPLEVSIAPSFVGKCDRLLLIEPEPHMAAEAHNVLKVPVFKVAVGMEAGSKTMIYNNGSSYLEGTWSPTPACRGSFEVEVVTFDTLDDGNIDILNLDCEGQEWAVLYHMISEPKLLAIEIWDDSPHYEQICQWLKDHDYKMRWMTGPLAETQIYTKE